MGKGRGIEKGRRYVFFDERGGPVTARGHPCRVTVCCEITLSHNTTRSTSLTPQRWPGEAEDGLQGDRPTHHRGLT